MAVDLRERVGGEETTVDYLRRCLALFIKLPNFEVRGCEHDADMEHVQ